MSERDIEAVFAGRVVREPELVEVQALLTSMREALVVEPPADHVSAFAAVLAQAAQDAPRVEPRKAKSSLRRRLVAIGVGVGISAFGVAGAAVANEAAPGDPLYGVDKALESVGILNGGTSERLQESEVLAKRGDVDGAVALTVKALDGDGQQGAAAALERAVAAVKSQSSGDDVRAQVSSMLAWMSQQKRGADFGANVSERAKEIIAANSGSKAKVPADPGSNAKAPANPGGNTKAPVDPGKNAKIPVDPGKNAKIPVEPGKNAKIPVDPGNNAKIPVDPGSNAKVPAAASDKRS